MKSCPNLCSEPSFGEAVNLISQCPVCCPARGLKYPRPQPGLILERTRDLLMAVQTGRDLWLAPWASDSRFRLVFPPLTGLVPDLSTAYSRVHRPTWTLLSLRGPLSHSNKPGLRVSVLMERMDDSPEARISLEAWEVAHVPQCIFSAPSSHFRF